MLALVEVFFTPSTVLSLSSLFRFFLTCASPTRACSLSLSFSSHRRVLPLHLPCHVSRGVPNATAPPLPQAITPHLIVAAPSRRLPAPRGISAKGGMPSGEPCPRPDAKDTSCPLRPCCALARANVHLTFTDHPTLKTLGHISRSHGRALLLESLHIQHSGTDHQSVGRLSSSLPLQSDPYASTSPRALRTPYRALNALSSTQMRTPHLTLRAFSRNHLLLHTKRADCTLPLPARCPARTSPPRCTSHLPATPKRCLRVCFHAFSVCTPARP